MSAEELLASSDGAARPVDYSPENVLDGKPMLAASEGVYLGIPVQVAFYFTTSPTELAAIDFLPVDGDCEKMGEAVQAQMGKPDASDEELTVESGVTILDRRLEWMTPENGGVVQYLEAGTSTGRIVLCKILLEPLTKAVQAT